MAYIDAVFREGGYPQKSVQGRILAFFLENLGRVATREQIQEAARDPKTGISGYPNYVLTTAIRSFRAGTGAI